MLVGTKTNISGLAERGRSISPDENSSRGGTETREGSPQFVEAYPIEETVEEVLEEAMEIPKKKNKKKRHPSADLYE
jgi:hypothetical protein